MFVHFVPRSIGRLGLSLLLALTLAVSAACSDSEGGTSTPAAATAATATATAATATAAAAAPVVSDGTLYIGGIPDQDPATIQRIFTLMAEYLGRETGLDVRFAPSVDYAAIVSAFQRGDVVLAWFGGLTGVQAAELVPGAVAIAQRPRDADFHSVFIAGADVAAESLTDLAGLTFTFGSESSTSGHLMPRFFLTEAGVNPDADFDGPPGYSGSHDRTYTLVESGAYQAGALNEAVWESAVANGSVDTAKVRVVAVTPPYFDYHWLIRPDVDERFGDGASERLHAALLALDASLGTDESELLTLFATDAFVETNNAHYGSIRQVAEGLGILR